MKLSSLISALVLTIATLAPTTQAQAQCNSTRTSGCSNCGGQIVYVLRTVGYDCHGCPVRRWVQQTHYCAPRRPSCDHDHGYSSNRRSSHNGNGSWSHRGTWRR